MKEIWKDIPGFEGLYQASTLGRIKRIAPYKNQYTKWGSNKILKPVRRGDGYLQVSLFKDGKRTRKLIHQLIAATFIPNPDNLPQVNHKNENKSSNEYRNLEWCTSKYNANYGTRNKRCREKLKNTSICKSVDQCLVSGTVVKTWNSIRSASRTLNINSTAISLCCKNKTGYKTAGGYLWKYHE